MNIGLYLRKVRKAQGMTLLQLSHKSKVQLATLSRIETGKMTGTLDSHVQIAKALGMTVPEFYSEVSKLEASQKEPKVTERTDLFVHEKGTSSIILTKDIFTKKILPVMIILQRGGKTHKEELKIGSEKFIYVLNGKIEALVGDEKKVLSKGATLYLDASKPHSLRNIGKDEAKCLCVLTPVSL